ncbi:hypothetical protein Tco_1259001 [Tanacetum coccineum]
MEWMVEPTAPRLLISVLPIMMLYGERHFTIANSISTVLLLPSLPIVTRRFLKQWDCWEGEFIHHVGPSFFKRSLAASFYPYHVYDLHIVPSLVPIPLVVLVDVLSHPQTGPGRNTCPRA